jgi:hypothetical protein
MNESGNEGSSEKLLLAQKNIFSYFPNCKLGNLKYVLGLDVYFSFKRYLNTFF